MQGFNVEFFTINTLSDLFSKNNFTEPKDSSDDHEAVPVTNPKKIREETLPEMTEFDLKKNHNSLRNRLSFVFTYS